jgi:hypothetical protein
MAVSSTAMPRASVRPVASTVGFPPQPVLAQLKTLPVPVMAF